MQVQKSKYQVEWSTCNGICLVYGPDMQYVSKILTKTVKTRTGSVFMHGFRIIAVQCVYKFKLVAGTTRLKKTIPQ